MVEIEPDSGDMTLLWNLREQARDKKEAPEKRCDRVALVLALVSTIAVHAMLIYKGVFTLNRVDRDGYMPFRRHLIDVTAFGMWMVLTVLFGGLFKRLGLFPQAPGAAALIPEDANPTQLAHFLDLEIDGA